MVLGSRGDALTAGVGEFGKKRSTRAAMTLAQVHRDVLASHPHMTTPKSFNGIDAAERATIARTRQGCRTTSTRP
jgi:hypothetical protein